MDDYQVFSFKGAKTYVDSVDKVQILIKQQGKSMLFDVSKEEALNVIKSWFGDGNKSLCFSLDSEIYMIITQD